VGYRFERVFEIASSSPSLLGLEENSLAGRTLEVTAGTNSGIEVRVSRNFEIAGEARIIVSYPFTQACDNTSVFTVRSTGLKFQDTSKSWTTNVWTGHVLTVGGREFFIKSNTSDTLTITPVFTNVGSP